MTSSTAPYDAICTLCASRESFRLTDLEYRAMKPRRCSRCGARAFVESVPETFRKVEGLPARSTRSGVVIRTMKSA
jgi:DNA-directed RNA polymerase subunit RPC12/RpoP